MDTEVSPLMGAADEELWEKEGLFSSVDKMCKLNGSRCHINEGLNSSLVFSSKATTPLSAGKKRSSRMCSASDHLQGYTTDGLRIKEGSGIDLKFRGSGITSTIEGVKVVEFSNRTGTLMKATLGGRTHLKGGFVKHFVRVWNPKKTKRRMVMGVDVGLEDSCNLSLSLSALVGRFAYRSQCKRLLVEWMSSTWESILGYSLELLTMPRGWKGFIFKKPEDNELILGRFWDYDGGSLMLKHWRIRFDPNTKYFSLCHLWVLLPGLPLHMWNTRALEAIGNVLG
jgi:hypothetical protein